MNNNKIGLIIDDLKMINEASNIKRNRIFIKQCKEYIYDYFIRSNFVPPLKKVLDFHFNSDINFGVLCVVKPKFTKENIIAVEDSKGRINIGLDTSVCDFSISESEAGSVIVDIIEKAVNHSEGLWVPSVYRFNKKSVLEAITDRLKKDGDYDKLINNSINGDWSSLNGRSKGEIVSLTKLYEDISSVYFDNTKNVKAWLELDEDAFKYITGNRKFIPIMIVDFDNGTIDYSTKENPGSDRKARDKFNIKDFANTGNIVFKEKQENWWYSKIKSIKIPIGLCNMRVESRYFD